MMKKHTQVPSPRRMMGAAAVALMIAATATGCSRKHGHLVIVGGGLSPQNTEVYDHMVELAGPTGTIGVLPTASGAPAQSGALAVGDFENHGARGRTHLIDITMTNPAQAANPDKAAEIRSHKLIYFVGGGDEEQVLNAFRPAKGDTSGLDALRDVLRSGGAIAGTSTSAAIMSDPAIRWGSSEQALLVGRTQTPNRGVGVGRGMGFFPYGLIDQHFLRRGSLARMAVAQEWSGQRFGFGVEENCAIAVDLATARITTMGPRALVLLDMKDATREGLSLANVRLSLLGDGDRLNGRTGRVAVAAGKPATTPDPKAEPYRTTDPWGAGMIANLIERMITDRTTAAEAEDQNFLLRLTATPESTLHAGTGEPPAISAVNLRLDIIAKPGAEAAAEKLRQEIAHELNVKRP